MRTFSSEFTHSYKTYSFGYCNYAQLEKGDVLSDVYAKGYLPYSGSPDVHHVFYMARSARLHLPTLELNSENRRIQKRFDGTFERHVTPRKAFEMSDRFLDFCLAYFKRRHGEHTMPPERLRYILDQGLITDIVTYTQNGKDMGYVFEVSDKQMTHFWYSCYDLEHAQQSLGMWLMIDSAVHAKTAKREHFYLGTVYGEKALYKANFSNVAYWNGSEWAADAKNRKLKERGRSDRERIFDGLDEWKRDQEMF